MADHMDQCFDPRGSEYLKNILLDISKAMGCDTPNQAINQFRQMMQEMEMANPISEPNHRASDLELLSTSVNPVRLKNNPIKLNEETIHALYEVIVK